MNWRAAVRLTGAGLVALGGIGVVAALFVPWSWAGLSDDPPGVALWAVIITLGPVASAVLALSILRGRSAGGSARPALAGAVASLAAGLIAAAVLAGIPPEHGIGPGGPVAVLACAAAFAGWLLLIPFRRVPPRPAAIPVAAATAVLLAAGLGAAPAVGWYAEGRFVRHTTGTASPPAPGGLPQDLGRQRWQAPAERTEPAVGPVAAGRHVILPQGRGARALDAVTGRTVWSYARDDVAKNLAGLIVTADGRMTVMSYQFLSGTLVVAVDTATGRERWRRQVRTGLFSGASRLVDAGDVLMLDSTYLGGDLVALRRGDGSPLWRRDTARLVPRCEGIATSVAAAGRVVAFLADCRDTHGLDTVIALSAADGRRLWTWPPSEFVGVDVFGVSVPIRSAGDRFWVAYSRTSPGGGGTTASAMLFDAETGAVSGDHPLPSGPLKSLRFPLIADGVILYPGEPAVGVDLASGRVRWQRRVPELAGWEPIDAVSRDGVAYLLLSPEKDPAAEQARSALMILALDVATGEVRARRPYDPTGCGAACGHDDDAWLLPGPGLLVVGSWEQGEMRVRGVG